MDKSEAQGRQTAIRIAQERLDNEGVKLSARDVENVLYAFTHDTQLIHALNVYHVTSNNYQGCPMCVVRNDKAAA